MEENEILIIIFKSFVKNVEGNQTRRKAIISLKKSHKITQIHPKIILSLLLSKNLYNLSGPIFTYQKQTLSKSLNVNEKKAKAKSLMEW